MCSSSIKIPGPGVSHESVRSRRPDKRHLKQVRADAEVRAVHGSVCCAALAHAWHTSGAVAKAIVRWLLQVPLKTPSCHNSSLSLRCRAPIIISCAPCRLGLTCCLPFPGTQSMTSPWTSGGKQRGMIHLWMNTTIWTLTSKACCRCGWGAGLGDWLGQVAAVAEGVELLETRDLGSRLLDLIP